MSDKLVNISKITLDVNGKEIELTLNEARQLKNILEETFKNSYVQPIRKETEYIPVYPWWYERPSPGWKLTWIGTDDSTGSVVMPENLLISKVLDGRL